MIAAHGRRGAAAALLCVALAGASCAVGVLPAPFPTEKGDGTSAPGKQPNFLVLGRLRWTRGGETAVLLREDGVLVDRGVPLGVVHANGTFMTADGKRTLLMHPDGSVHVITGMDVTIDQDGTATTRVHGQPDETLTLEQASQPRGGRPALTLEGGSPKLFRAAMWILMIPDLLRVQADSDD